MVFSLENAVNDRGKNSSLASRTDTRRSTIVTNRKRERDGVSEHDVHEKREETAAVAASACTRRCVRVRVDQAAGTASAKAARDRFPRLAATSARRIHPACRRFRRCRREFHAVSMSTERSYGSSHVCDRPRTDARRCTALSTYLNNNNPRIHSTDGTRQADRRRGCESCAAADVQAREKHYHCGRACVAESLCAALSCTLVGAALGQGRDLRGRGGGVSEWKKRGIGEIERSRRRFYLILLKKRNQ